MAPELEDIDPMTIAVLPFFVWGADYRLRDPELGGGGGVGGGVFLNNNGPLSPYWLFCSPTGLELVHSSHSLPAPSLPKQTKAFKKRGGDRDRGYFISYEDASKALGQYIFISFWKWFRAPVLAMTLALGLRQLCSSPCLCQPIQKPHLTWVGPSLLLGALYTWLLQYAGHLGLTVLWKAHEVVLCLTSFKLRRKSEYNNDDSVIINLARIILGLCQCGCKI